MPAFRILAALAAVSLLVATPSLALAKKTKAEKEAAYAKEASDEALKTLRTKLSKMTKEQRRIYLNAHPDDRDRIKTDRAARKAKEEAEEE